MVHFTLVKNILIPVSAQVSPPPPGFGRVGLHTQPNAKLLIIDRSSNMVQVNKICDFLTPETTSDITWQRQIVKEVVETLI